MLNSRHYIKTALIGWSLGFAGCCLVDFFDWRPCECTFFEALTDPYYMRSMELSFPADPAKAQNLCYQKYVLFWLMQHREELAFRAASLVAVLSVSSVFAMEHMRAKKTARKDESGSELL